MNIKLFNFPTLVPENYSEITARVDELHRKYRDHKPLDGIEIDWLDSANNWLNLN